MIGITACIPQQSNLKRYEKERYSIRTGALIKKSGLTSNYNEPCVIKIKSFTDELITIMSEEKPYFVGIEVDEFCRVSDKQLALMSGLPKLRSLALGDISITRESIFGDFDLLQLSLIESTSFKKWSILDYLPNLEVLHTCGGDEMAEHLPSLKKLKELRISWSELTDRGMEYLAQCESLERLSLHNIKVSPASFSSLSALKNLKYLEIERCTSWPSDTPESEQTVAFTDETLEALTDLPLQSISIENCRVSDRVKDIVKKFSSLNKASFPDCPNITRGAYSYNRKVKADENRLSELDSLIGQSVELRLKNGLVIEGLFSGRAFLNSNFENAILIKNDAYFDQVVDEEDIKSIKNCSIAANQNTNSSKSVKGKAILYPTSESTTSNSNFLSGDIRLVWESLDGESEINQAVKKHLQLIDEKDEDELIAGLMEQFIRAEYDGNTLKMTFENASDGEELNVAFAPPYMGAINEKTPPSWRKLAALHNYIFWQLGDGSHISFNGIKENGGCYFGSWDPDYLSEYRMESEELQRKFQMLEANADEFPSPFNYGQDWIVAEPTSGEKEPELYFAPHDGCELEEYGTSDAGALLLDLLYNTIF
jgi:hypothetical protein